MTVADARRLPPRPAFDPTAELAWLPKAEEAMEYFHIAKEQVLGVLSHPGARWGPEKTKQAIGEAWNVVVGDIFVTVGFADEVPAVLYVRRRRYTDYRKIGSGRSGNVGVGWPRTKRELVERVLALGYRIEFGRAGHDRIVHPDGTVVSGIAGTPSDRNSYEASYRAVLNDKRRRDQGDSS